MATNVQGGFNWSTLRSIPFVILIVSNVALWLATNGSTLSPHFAYIFTAVSAGLYAVGRGLAKWNSDGRPFYLTTEFYVLLVGALVASWGGFQGHLSAGVYTAVATALAGAALIAEGLRTPPTVALDRHGR